jgi:hypothetical protein
LAWPTHQKVGDTRAGLQLPIETNYSFMPSDMQNFDFSIITANKMLDQRQQRDFNLGMSEISAAAAVQTVEVS